MSIKFQYSRKKYIWIGIMFVFALGMWIWSRYPLPLILAFTALYALIIGLEITLPDTTPKWWTKVTDSGMGSRLPFLKKMTVTWSNMISWVITALLMWGGAWLSTWCMQRVILEDEFFVKTGKTAMRLNMYCILILYLGMLCVFARARWAFIVSHTLVLIIAFADYFVYEFRQNEIVFADLDTIGTGLSVASQYRFRMSVRGALILLLTVLIFSLVRKFRFKFRHPFLIRIPLLIAVILMVPWTWNKMNGRITQTWEKKGSYRNGFIVNFILGIRDSRVTEPSGYSEDVIKDLENAYQRQYEEELAAKKDAAKPTIITIMNESFADFRLIGDLQTNVEMMPFLDSLQENTTRGFAMSSVFGAKTPNSEWEYLTGNSMAFMPGGSVVYQQFMQDDPTSMVSNLKNMGYTTIAMHPYFKSGWSRNTVYPKMGFDEMRFMDTGDFDETKVLREYITDQEMFDKLIERYEQKEKGEPLFIMGVTMQNHGGYKEEYDNFVSDVYQVGGYYYPDAAQYLSLVRQTDMAMENLIGYFSQVDEPVEIIFFGDHYPSLDAGFIRSLNSKGVSGLTLSELEDLFSVPFFIWTNYDSEEEQIERTSLNYLGTMALEKAGLPLPAYNLFLKDLMEVIPAMNIRGYQSLSQGKFLHIGDAQGEERQWLRNYRYLQYNNLFDEDGRSSLFFPRLNEAE